MILREIENLYKNQQWRQAAPRMARLVLLALFTALVIISLSNKAIKTSLLSMHGDDWNLDEQDRQEQRRQEPAAVQFTPRDYSNTGRLDSADKTNLINHGAEVYDDATPYIVGKTITRPGRGHCLYHSLNETNDIQIATESRVTLANYIHANQNMQIGTSPSSSQYALRLATQHSHLTIATT